MSASNPDSFSSNGPFLFEAREVLDKLIDDVDALLTNKAEDFDAAVLSPQEEDREFLSHATKCSSCTQVLKMLRDDEGNAKDPGWDPEDSELSENSNENRSWSFLDRSSDSNSSLEGIFLAYLSIPYNVIEDEIFEDDDAIDGVQINASDEEVVGIAVDVGDRDFDVLEGSDMSLDEILVSLLSIPNNEGSEADNVIDVSPEEAVNVARWDDMSDEGIVVDEDDIDEDDIERGNLDILDVLFMFFAEEGDQEQLQHQQQGGGDHPPGPREGNVLDEMD